MGTSKETEIKEKQRNRLGEMESGDVEAGLCGGEGRLRRPHNHQRRGGGSGEERPETAVGESGYIRESRSLQRDCGNRDAVEERHGCRRRRRQNDRHRQPQRAGRRHHL